MAISISLSLIWRLWPLLHWEWFYTRWEYCRECVDELVYQRRALTLRIELPFAVLAISTGPWFKWGQHNHR